MYQITLTPLPGCTFDFDNASEDDDAKCPSRQHRSNGLLGGHGLILEHSALRLQGGLLAVHDPIWEVPALASEEDAAETNGRAAAPPVANLQQMTDGCSDATKNSPAESIPKWTFTPGQAAYGGVEFAISGTKAKLLEALANARRALTQTELIDQAWNGHYVTYSTVRSQVANLRKLLRQAFGIGQKDPLPNVDFGDRTAWRLDTDCLSRFSANSTRSQR